MQHTRKRASSQKLIDAFSSVTSKRSISVLSLLLIIVALPVTVFLMNHQTEVQSHAATVYYPTLPPGSSLPSDADCAAQVIRNSWEPRSDNYSANHTTFPNYQVQPTSNPETIYVNRVTGNFTGTTDEIFQWASCKWGIELNWIRAQAVVESDWRQSTLGDCNGSPYLELNGCQSLGILQIKGANQPPDYPGTYPYALQSTAFNVDYAMAVRRACFDGKVTWLGNGYKAGDLLGCMGEWFSGDWYSQGAIDYMNKVQQAYNNQTWNTYGAGLAPTFSSNTPTPQPTVSINPTHTPTPTLIPTFTPTPTYVPTATPTTQGNLIKNSSFENIGSQWLSPWIFQKTSRANAKITQSTNAEDGSYAAMVTVNKNTRDWYVQLMQPNRTLTAGKIYSISFWAKTGGNNLTADFVLQSDHGSYPIYLQKYMNLSSSWQHFTYTFTANVSDTDADIGFNLGANSGNYYIDNVSMVSN